MPRTKYDVIRDIGKLRGSYSRGKCVDCGKEVKEGSEKVVKSYDICWGCYDSDADPAKNRLMSLINELERLTK